MYSDVLPASRLVTETAGLIKNRQILHGKEKVNGSIPLGGSADAEQAGGPEPEAM